MVCLALAFRRRGRRHGSHWEAWRERGRLHCEGSDLAELAKEVSERVVINGQAGWAGATVSQIEESKSV